MPGCHGAAFSASGAQAEGPFREDGYFNMTKAAKHFGKRLDHFMTNRETKEYIAAIREVIPGITGITQTKAGWHLNEDVGTWAHPKLAVFFARWLDVRFAVWCDMQIDDILHGRSVVVPVQQAQQAPAVTLTMEQVNEAIRAAVAPLEQRIAGLLAAPVSVPPSVISVKNCLRSGAIPLQRICPAVHQKPAKATTTP